VTDGFRPGRDGYPARHAAAPVAPHEAVRSHADRAAAPGRCQGRSMGINSRRTRPCSRLARVRIDGTGGLAAVLCGQHARVATDRPHVIWEWLRQSRA
jgi:hypothetical protein